MSGKRFPLPKRFSAAMSEKAYINLRELNAKYGYGNNYLLTILLENLDEFANAKKLDTVFQRYIDEYGAPEPGEMKKKVVKKKSSRRASPGGRRNPRGRTIGRIKR